MELEVVDCRHCLHPPKLFLPPDITVDNEESIDIQKNTGATSTQNLLCNPELTSKMFLTFTVLWPQAS
eukprot:308448-Pelagomonas_calceolata.AAC.1